MTTVQGQSGAGMYTVSYVNVWNKLIEVEGLSWDVASRLMENLLLGNDISASLVFVRCGVRGDT